MDLLDLLGLAAGLLFRALVVAAPLLAWQWAVLFSRHFRGGHGSSDATVVSGCMVGLAMLPLLIPPMALSWDGIVTPGGVWDLTLGEFLGRAVRYQLRAEGELLRGVLTDDDRANLLAWCGLAALIWLVRIGSGLAQRRGRRARALLIAEVTVFAASVHGTVYFGTLALWSINQLNFWVLLVVIILLQDYRHNEPPLFPRIIAALSGRNRYREPEAEPVRVVD